MEEPVKEPVICMGVEEILQLECPHCGYEWKSAAGSDRVCCPKCRKSFSKKKKPK
jgi:protein-arginine kinase activator protein McsA